MNRSIFRRVFWKEYRQQRSLWIAMACVSLMLTLLVFEFIVGNPDFTKIQQLETLLATALGLPALYLLGSGAALFAGEHEAGTFEFQQSLPTGAGPVFAAKVLFALLSEAALLLPMWLLVLTLTCRPWERSGGESGIVAAWGTQLPLFALQMFVWATLFSLLLRRVLIAAVLGVAVASIAVPIVGLELSRPFVAHPITVLGYWRAGSIAIVGLVDVWLGLRWFRLRRDGSRGDRLEVAKDALATASSGVVRSAHAMAASPPLTRRWAVSALGRLVWQHGRQSLVTMLVFSLLLVPVAVTVLVRQKFDLNDPRDQLLMLSVLGLALAAVPLIGQCAFMSDQRRCSYRFLADRGMPPGRVWLSRQAVIYGYLTCLVLIPALLFALFEYVASPTPAGMIGEMLAFVVGYVVLGLAVGQFCAMFVPSGLLAGVVSIPLTALLAGWCCVMAYLQVSWLWSAAPIPVALLLATRLRTAGWLVERSDARAWFWPATALVLPAVAILVGLPVYRAYQFPLVDPGFSVEQFTRPLSAAEKATIDLYKEAGAKLVAVPTRTAQETEVPVTAETQREAPDPTAWERDAVDANRDVIAILVKASREPVAPTEQAINAFMGSIPLVRGFRLLTWSAARHEFEGKLDAAFDEYLAALRIAALSQSCDPAGCSFEGLESLIYIHVRQWATRPHQTPERLIAAGREIGRPASGLTATDGWLKLQYVMIERFLLGDARAVNWFLFNFSVDRAVPPLTKAWLGMPWERQRAVRLLNRLTRHDLDVLRARNARPAAASESSSRRFRGRFQGEHQRRRGGSDRYSRTMKTRTY